MSRSAAIERVREAQTDWDEAIRAHEQVMPELDPFAARLRATSRAAARQAAAFEYAAEAGLGALEKDTVVRHPPHELSPAAMRPGDPQTWEQFDDAVCQWQDAWRSGSTITVAQALRRLATLTEMLADEVDQLARNTTSAESAAHPGRASSSPVKSS
jgi:hypothetical protein